MMDKKLLFHLVLRQHGVKGIAQEHALLDVFVDIVTARSLRSALIIWYRVRNKNSHVALCVLSDHMEVIHRLRAHHGKLQHMCRDQGTYDIEIRQVDRTATW